MSCPEAERSQAQLTGHITRRGFLRVGGMTLATLGIADHLGWVLPMTSAETAIAAAAPKPGRRLIILELNGGNDGLNTLIPFGDGTYYDLRARVAIPQSSVLKLDSTWGLHPALKRLHARARAGQATFVHGVGVPQIADLSHFGMQALWRAGDAEAARSGASGWAGRMLAAMSDAAKPLGGLSIAPAPSPLLMDPDARVAAAPDPSRGQFAFPDGQADPLRRALTALAHADDAEPLLRTARAGLAGTFAIHEMCAGLDSAAPAAYPRTEFGQNLAFTAQLLGSQPGLRVVHIPVPLDFDTHDNQQRRQATNLAVLDAGVDALMRDLDSRGLSSTTAVVVTSEFGRRVEDNGSQGTDHGGANTLFVLAPGLRNTVAGAPPPLNRLDDDGNLVPTVSYRDYLAAAIEGWMGVPATSILPGSRPLSLW